MDLQSSMTTIGQSRHRIASQSSRISHGRSKFCQYCNAVISSRSSIAFIAIVLLVCVYALWSTTPADDESMSNTADVVADGKEIFLICSENFVDARQHFPDTTRKSSENLSVAMIYFVTPTFPRREQIPELIRLGQTLMHVPHLHWIVANDKPTCNAFLDTVLLKLGVPFTLLATPMPMTYRHLKNVPRGVANRRAAIKWLQQRNISSGVLYFGDDDNTYDLKLFSEIRDTNRVSMFPVGLIGDYGVSGPVVKEGKVVGFFDSWPAKRKWPVDMAGFAVNLAYMADHPKATMPYVAGHEEDRFLRSISLELEFIEPRGNNCTEVLVWHTRTKKESVSNLRIAHRYLDDRSNLGALLKGLHEMGISNIADNQGITAVIIRNGHAQPVDRVLR